MPPKLTQPAETDVAKITGAYCFPTEPSPQERWRLLHTQDRAAHLAEISKTLFDSIEFSSAMNAIAQAAIQVIADWCILDVVDEDGIYRRAAVRHRDPAKANLAQELENSFPPQQTARGVPSHVLRTGQPLVIPHVTDEHYRATARSPRHEYLLRSLESSSYICVPLMARGHFLGALTLVSSEVGHSYSPEDVIYAQEFCSRVALAVDNCLLYRKAQKAIQLREEVINIVSHDLKNPLMAIEMATKLIERSQDREDRRKYISSSLKNIRSSTERMQNLISDLLDLSKLEAGAVPFTPRPGSARMLLEETLELFQSIALSRSISLVTTNDMDFIFECDFDRIFQVVSNLMGNALKFTPDGGAIEITAACIDGEAVFSVRDSGPGILPEQLPYIFDRFWQAKDAVRKGTGLGLAISKAIIDAHGGRIWATSEPGRGCHFHFALSLQSERIRKGAH